MPLPKKWHKKKTPPAGFDILEPTLEALEHELRDKIQDTNAQKRKTESIWPVHQINWQKSRYVYDMYYTYHKISKSVYNYCISQKYIDAALIAKWKKPGYERLCSTYVINPTNYKFGTTSICRVPYWDRSPAQRGSARDPTTGCLGCASGKGAGPKNIFGNKYGQYLAAVQIARETRLEEEAEKKRKREEEEEAAAKDGDDDEEETDDDDDEEEDYGPQPVAGIWAGSQKLQHQSEQMMKGDDGEEETDDEDDDEDDEGPPLPPPAKKVRQE